MTSLFDFDFGPSDPPKPTKSEPTTSSLLRGSFDPHAKISDVGEIIPFARKFMSVQRINLEDYMEAPDSKKAELCKRDTIWPKPDFEELTNEIGRINAGLISAVYAAISTSPKIISNRRKISAEDYQTSYIRGIVFLRDNIIENLSDPNETINEAIKAYTETYLLLKNALNYDKNDSYALKDETFKFFALSTHSTTHSLCPYSIKNRLTKLLDGPFPATKKKNGQKPVRKMPVLVRPHLADLQRTGTKNYTGFIAPEQFKEHFGFRGVQFGNWLPNDERQTVLNKGFDALCDLAEILDIPPSALSLGGNLAIAFGARGTAGGGAAAYEPQHRVFNLTRLKGAGSIAHEWFHAWDNHLCWLSSGTKNLADQTSYLTAAIHSRLVKKGRRVPNAFLPLNKTIWKNISPEDEAAMRSFLTTLYFKPLKPDEYTRKDSLYYLDAVTYGQKNYTASPEEMSARAFESWVYDKIHERGETSDYLVHHVAGIDFKRRETTDPEAIAFDAFLRWMAQYPADEERTAIKAAITDILPLVRKVAMSATPDDFA